MCRYTKYWWRNTILNNSGLVFQRLHIKFISFQILNFFLLWNINDVLRIIYPFLHSSKYLILCFTEESKRTTKVGTTGRLVYYDKMFIFCWTIPKLNQPGNILLELYNFIVVRSNLENKPSTVSQHFEWSKRKGHGYVRQIWPKDNSWVYPNLAETISTFPLESLSSTSSW